MNNLNRPELLELYISWTKQWGLGRNRDDLRFGQWVWLHWGPQLRGLVERKDQTLDLADGFSAESPEIAYQQIYKLLEY
jgi:hypothetical protein